VTFTYISLAAKTPGGEATVTLTPIPEPAVWATMLMGLGLLGAVVRRVRYSIAP
jgi:hypothetical protein